MSSYSYHKHDLPNGIRIRAVNVPGSPTVTFGVLVGAGSRHETDSEAGIAHFIEHNMFKGTPKRPSSQIITSTIEGVGGIQNAFTGHECTGFWAKAEASELPTLVEVISDLFLNPLFPEKDLEIERGNVIEELNMYEDNPQSKVELDFYGLAFPNHPLGREIVGTKNNLLAFKREDLLSFRSRKYDPRQIVVIAAGDVNPESFFVLVESLFNNYVGGVLDVPSPFVREASATAKVLTTPRKLDQAHLIMGFYGLNENDAREEVLEVANEILGAPRAMSSRLFNRLREQMGVAYYVHSETGSFAETGLWAVSAGVTTSKLTDSVKAILEEFQKIAASPVTEEELLRAKAHIKGQLAFGLETSNGWWQFFGMQELVKTRLDTPEEVIAKIDAVTKEDIEKLSKELVQKDKLNLAVLGDFNSANESTKLLNLLTNH